jgi:hypothetical protein
MGFDPSCFLEGQDLDAFICSICQEVRGRALPCISPSKLTPACCVDSERSSARRMRGRPRILLQASSFSNNDSGPGKLISVLQLPPKPHRQHLHLPILDHFLPALSRSNQARPDSTRPVRSSAD